jgi:hypothetical protein
MLANYVKAFLHPWLARRGAIVRWNELQSELSDVLKAFTDPRDAQLNVARRVPRNMPGTTIASSDVDRRGIRSRKMSAAAGRAASLRMKKYCTRPLCGSYIFYQSLVAASLHNWRICGALA